MGLLELFILVLGLAIVAVLLRGVYIALQARKGQLRMQLEKNIPEYDADSLTLSELPNGGARLVERSFAQVVKQNSDFAKQENKSTKGIPVLMDSVDDESERSSSIANARQAARKKHVMGRSTVAPAASVKAAAPVVPEPPKPAIVDEPYAVSGGDDDYEDPIANHVFADEAAETGELAPQSYAPDDELEHAFEGGYSGDDIEDESESLVGSGFSSNALADSDEDDEVYNPADEDVLEHDEDAFEDEDFVGDGPEATVGATQSPNQTQEDDDWDANTEHNDIQDSELDDEQMAAEPFDSVYAEEAPVQAVQEDDEQDLAFSGDDQGALEDDFDETDSDDDYESDDSSAQSSDDYDDEDALEDDSRDEYEDSDEDYDGFDDDEPRAMHDDEPSGPRSWLKWAGNKLSEMGNSPSEDDARSSRSERAEPRIGEDSFEEVMRPAPTPKPRTREKAQAAAAQAQSTEQEQARAAHFDRSHQNQLDLAMPEEQAAPAPAPAPAKAAVKQPEPKAEPAAVQTEFSEVLVINVVAKPDRDIDGTDLLQVLLANGLIFGEMSIFHRHLDQNRESPVLFSVANLVNPGTFDLNQISSFETKGLCFFLTLPNVATSMQAFDKMLEIAQQVRVALDCDLKDDNRSVMTAQTIEHYRQRVREFDLRQLTAQK